MTQAIQVQKNAQNHMHLPNSAAAWHDSLWLSEADALARLQNYQPDVATRERISVSAVGLIERIRHNHQPALMEAMLLEYGLSTQEGVALMCLAEAMLRVPDVLTMDDLIEDKIADGAWHSHQGQSPSHLINASTWGLMLTGKLLREPSAGAVKKNIMALLKRVSEPVIRVAVGEMLKRLGKQFVLGEYMTQAVQAASSEQQKGYTYSYDMLGEAAKTEQDALRYMGAYSDAIAYLATQCASVCVADNPGISVKLSALYPRYEVAQRADVLRVLVGRSVCEYGV
jgi:RHH-type transcriptional regulator, proline utilization regulon repressor / proline dehydrogenase / delta 1-pyrroline-5-carboxylate dehydrogenase